MTTPTNTESTVAAPLASGIAVALLEAVKALPLSDQEAFTKLFQAWASTDEQTAVAEAPKEDAPVEWPDFAGRMKVLFPNGPIPGDPQEFWDEMRRG